VVKGGKQSLDAQIRLSVNLDFLHVEIPSWKILLLGPLVFRGYYHEAR